MSRNPYPGTRGYARAQRLANTPAERKLRGSSISYARHGHIRYDQIEELARSRDSDVPIDIVAESMVDPVVTDPDERAVCAERAIRALRSRTLADVAAARVLHAIVQGDLEVATDILNATAAWPLPDEPAPVTSTRIYSVADDTDDGPSEWSLSAAFGPRG